MLSPFVFPATLFSAPASPSAARTQRSAPSAAGPTPRRFEAPPIEIGHSEGLEVDRATPRLPCDLVETSAAFCMRFDVAGAEREAVGLDVGHRTRDLRVTVHRLRGKAAAEELRAAGATCLSSERHKGGSARRIVLPSCADWNSIESAIVDGMLLVKVGKLAGTQELQATGRRAVPVQ